MITLTDYLKKNINAVSGVLIDIDGTLKAGVKAIPGAADFLRYLNGAAIPYVLVTNDGDHSTLTKSEHLRKTGIDVSADKIVSCSDPIVQYVAQHNCQGSDVFVMGNLGTPCFATAAGLKPTRDIHKIDACAGVIIGEHDYQWESTINAVINSFTRNPKQFLIVPNPDSYWPDGRGGIGVAAGAIARFIKGILKEHGFNIAPIYLGKPYAPIYAYAQAHLRDRYALDSAVDSHTFIMVGDSLASDVTGANAMGFTSAVVLTGITTRAAAENAQGEQKPQLIFDRLF